MSDRYTEQLQKKNAALDELNRVRDVCTKFRELNDELTAENKRLKGLTRKAYTQGWEDGCHNKGWNSSERERRITALESEE
jgi:hypothetical protein